MWRRAVSICINYKSQMNAFHCLRLKEPSKGDENSLQWEFLMFTPTLFQNLVCHLSREHNIPEAVSSPMSVLSDCTCARQAGSGVVVSERHINKTELSNVSKHFPPPLGSRREQAAWEKSLCMQTTECFEQERDTFSEVINKCGQVQNGHGLYNFSAESCFVFPQERSTRKKVKEC